MCTCSQKCWIFPDPVTYNYVQYVHVRTCTCMFLLSSIQCVLSHRVILLLLLSWKQDSQSSRLTCEIYVGPVCNVEFRQEESERRFLAAFTDIDAISYETELMSRGRVTMDIRGATMVSSHVMSMILLFCYVCEWCVCVCV